MALLYPFRAWRYSPAHVRLDDVVTQPYDKITPAMQQAYYQKSPYNLTRIILGLPELFDAERGESVYGRAARDFAAWRAQGVLIQEKTPCVFAYAQRFQIPGSSETYERRGFIALGKLYDYADQVVFRHEQTLAKPKSDRMNLLKATKAHFGQIFMLYSDPARTVQRILYDGNGSPDVEVTDEYGVQHRLWRISDPAAIRLLTTTMADKKLIIADGHHRYETALQYSREHAPANPARTEKRTGELPHPPFPEAAVMMTFVNMDAEGLVILPTHRVIHGLTGFDENAFLMQAGKFFAAEKLPGADPAAWLAALNAQPGTAFVVALRSGAWLLGARPQETAPILESLPQRQRNLDLACLHSVVLEHLLGLNAEAVRQESNIHYLRDTSEAVDRVRRGEANLAFLVKPVTMEQLKEVAFAGEVMPQKSTDFYPKLLSGLTIYALE
jgi:uncharacterized protein (DUF1015 family)